MSDSGRRGGIRVRGVRDCPAGFPVKGNEPSMYYYPPGSSRYDSVVPEICFRNAEDAEAAGFRALGTDAPGEAARVAAVGAAVDASAAETRRVVVPPPAASEEVITAKTERVTAPPTRTAPPPPPPAKPVEKSREWWKWLLGLLALGALAAGLWYYFDDDDDEDVVTPTVAATVDAGAGAVGTPDTSTGGADVATPVATEATGGSDVATPDATTGAVAATPDAGATAMAAASPAASPSPVGSPSAALEIVMLDMRFDPNTLTIPADTASTVTFVNDGAAVHTFSIEELDINVSVPVGGTGEVEINAPAGEYKFICTEAGHEAAGMTGTLTVE